MAGYLRPRDLETALAAMAEAPRTVVAGGTDYYPARVGRPLDDDVLDVTGIESLREIEDLGDRWRIGALVTWTRTIETPLPPMFDGLKRAAREVGGVQVQNSGTVVGNVCNASPAADGVPNLLALDAEIELASRDAPVPSPSGSSSPAIGKPSGLRTRSSPRSRFPSRPRERRAAS